MSTAPPRPPIPHLELTNRKRREKVGLKEPVLLLLAYGIPEYPVFVPHLDIVAGFSLTSTPRLLEEKNLIELAIKKAHVNPVVRWLHEEATPGSLVQVRVGGGFFLEDLEDTPHNPLPSPPDEAIANSGSAKRPNYKNVILIAGGVGATPLISMATHIVDRNLQSAASARATGSPMNLYRATMLYSVRHTSELLFSERLRQLAETPNSGLSVKFFISQRGPARFEPGAQDMEVEKPHDVYSIVEDKHSVHYCHIDQNVLSLQWRDSVVKGGSDPVIYMCGPPSMEQDVVNHLSEIKFPSSNLFFEQWW
ncbi:hypothetical protein HDU67_009567 [Dinochytrium kinnereticum]|nr:hypothetical protein HDU67_009567 [Dinochytrium kinnereticum]